MNHALNSGGNSGPSVGASSLVTDANSALSGGPNLQRSASINADSFMRLPASPMSFSSGNISLSGSSVVEGPSVVQQSGSSVKMEINQDHQSSHQVQQRPSSSATSITQQSQHQTTLQNGQILSMTQQHGNQHTPYINQQSMQLLANQALGGYNQEQKNMQIQHGQLQRGNVRQDDMLQQHFLQQLLQRQDSSFPVQSLSPQMQAALQNQRMLQRQQLLQSMSPDQRLQLQQQQQQQQLRQQLLLQQQNMQAVGAAKRPFESGVCSRRIMQFMYHQRQRPPDNNLTYWRQFVAEFFAPRAKKRWCLAMYDGVGQNALGAFPQSSLDLWQCEICGSKSGKGFETTVEALPRLKKIKYESGVLDELLFMDDPKEYRLPTGAMLLECAKATEESVYEHRRVVREGQLRVVFTPDLKMLSWEFCARRHEELLPRRLVAPQVSQLVQVVQNYQNAVSESGSSGLSSQDLQTNCGMFVAAGRQIARVLELQSLNDLGFSKRYIRCLQISEVVNSMKDLIDFGRENHLGPVASLKNYPKQSAASKLQTHNVQVEQMLNQNMNASLIPFNRILNAGLRSNLTVNNLSNGPLNSSPAALTLNNMRRQNSMHSNSSIYAQDAPTPTPTYSGSNQASSQNASLRGPISAASASLQNQAGSQQQSSVNMTVQSSQMNQQLQQQHVIQHLMQEMSNNNSGRMNHQSLNAKSGSIAEGFNGGNMTPRNGIMGGQALGHNMPNNASVTSQVSSMKNITNNPVSVSSDHMTNDVPQNFDLSDILPYFTQDLPEDAMFNSDAVDMGYGWKS